MTYTVKFENEAEQQAVYDAIHDRRSLAEDRAGWLVETDAGGRAEEMAGELYELEHRIDPTVKRRADPVVTLERDHVLLVLCTINARAPELTALRDRLRALLNEGGAA